MYEQHFELTRKPFAAAPDTHFLYSGWRTREALARLTYGIRDRCGLAMLVGDAGTGKTVVARALIEELRPTARTVLINHTTMMRHDMLRTVLQELGVEDAGPSRPEMIRRIQEILTTEADDGREPAVLVIDEAQNLRTHVYEEIRLLTNLESEHGKLLQVVLVGQPELEARLDRPSLQSIRQRVVVRVRLEPLTAVETAEYVRHRLRVAGSKANNLISTDAMEHIREASEGIPRVINTLCDHALLHACNAGQKTVDGASVRAAMVDCGLAESDSPEETIAVPVSAPIAEEGRRFFSMRNVAAAGAATLMLGAAFMLMPSREAATAESAIVDTAIFLDPADSSVCAPALTEADAGSSCGTEEAAIPATQPAPAASSEESAYQRELIAQIESLAQQVATLSAKADEPRDLAIAVPTAPAQQPAATVEPEQVEIAAVRQESPASFTAPRVAREQPQPARNPETLTARPVIKNDYQKPVEFRTEPVAIVQIEPDLSRREVKRAGSEEVALRVLVNEDGGVVRVVVDGPGSGSKFEAAAIKAVLQWKYLPAREHGKTVRFWVTERFSLNSETRKTGALIASAGR